MTPQTKTPSPHSNRRRFLMGTAGACAALGAGTWFFRGSSGHLRFTRRTSHALGASVSMSVWHRDQDAAEAALDAAFAELELVESVMSLYRPESEVSRLNRDKTLDHPHPHLLKVLGFAAEIAGRSGGAFDVTVQPLWELHRRAQSQGRLPDDAELREACANVDWRRVECSAERVRLLGESTAITLNGIAQGFAADAAMAALRRAGVVHALIDTGEMGALGGKPDGEAWKVGIQHPRQPAAFISLAKLQDRCLATSGDYETRFSADFVHHHLFDPRSGHSPAEFASVSITAPTSMMADALSTAVFVLGAERGLELLRRMPDTDALFVFKDGRISATDGFPVTA